MFLYVPFTCKLVLGLAQQILVCLVNLEEPLSGIKGLLFVLEISTWALRFWRPAVLFRGQGSCWQTQRPLPALPNLPEPFWIITSSAALLVLLAHCLLWIAAPFCHRIVLCTSSFLAALRMLWYRSSASLNGCPLLYHSDLATWWWIARALLLQWKRPSPLCAPPSMRSSRMLRLPQLTPWWLTPWSISWLGLWGWS